MPRRLTTVRINVFNCRWWKYVLPTYSFQPYGTFFERTRTCTNSYECSNLMARFLAPVDSNRFQLERFCHRFCQSFSYRVDNVYLTEIRYEARTCLKFISMVYVSLSFVVREKWKAEQAISLDGYITNST